MTENETKAIRWIENIRDDTVIVKEEILDSDPMRDILPHVICQERNINAEIIIKAISELDKYRSIGTVEECQEARERQKEKKPNLVTPCKSVNYYQCPVCREQVSMNENFCNNCGQALYWKD